MATFRILGISLLVLAVVPTWVFAEGPPPGAIPEVDPAEYCLLKGDIPQDWTWAPPEGKEEGAGSGITTEGRQITESWWRMEIEQVIIVTITRADGQQVPLDFYIVGTVLKSSEYAKMGWDRWLAAGGLPAWIPDGWRDQWRMGPCSEKLGEEARQGYLGDKPVAAFSFRHKAYVGHVTGPAHSIQSPDAIRVARQIAQLLAAKVSRAKPPVVNDLDIAILPDDFRPTSFHGGNHIPIEPSADRHGIVVIVRNLSSKVPAQKVEVRLWQGQPGYQGCIPLGEPAYIENMPPTSWRKVNLTLPLSGNVENLPLYVQALPVSQEDSDPSNNATGMPLSIYYANNGTRAYSFPDDGYSFENWGVAADDVAHMVEGFLSTIVGHVESDPRLGEVFQRLLFPQTFTRFVNYLDASTKMGAGGHCYGMCATSALYFLDSSLRPTGSSTSALSRSDASFNINAYHRAQMTTLFKTILTGEMYHARDEGVANTVEAIRSSLRDERKPIIIEFFGKVPDLSHPGQKTVVGHAVLAYKMVDWNEGQYCVYLYDPNFPANKVSGKAIPSFTFDTNRDVWRFPPYMGYSWANSQWVSAQPLTRDIPLSVANAFVPDIKKALRDMAETLNKANQLMASLRCPADALITDEQGRSVGVRNGQVVTDIPNAAVLASGEVEVYLLPAGHQYAVSIKRAGPGAISFDLIRPEGSSKLAVVSFGGLPIADGGMASMTIRPDNGITPADIQGQKIAPSLTGHFDGDTVSRTEVIKIEHKPASGPQRPGAAGAPPGPAVSPPAPKVSAPVICTDVKDGKPVAPGDTFDRPRKIFCWLSFENMSDDTEIRCVWTRNGQQVGTGKRAVKGTGALWFSISADGGDGGLQPGAYAVSILHGQTSLGAATFTIREATTQRQGSRHPQPPDKTPLVICTDVQDGKPVGAGTVFGRVPKIFCWLPFQDLPANTEVVCVWRKDDSELTRSKRTVSGTGWVWFSIAMEGGLTPGSYSVSVTAGPKILGSANFKIQ